MGCLLRGCARPPFRPSSATLQSPSLISELPVTAHIRPALPFIRPLLPLFRWHPPPPKNLRPLPPQFSLSADRVVILDDLHSFDPATMIWTLLSAANDTLLPSARSGHGFTSAGGRLYVHGGYSYQGDADAVGNGYG
jgi:hypothetical protein